MTQEQKNEIALQVKNAIAAYDYIALKEMAIKNEYALSLVITQLLMDQEKLEHIKNILN